MLIFRWVEKGLFQTPTHSTKLKVDHEESNTQFCFQSKGLVHTGSLIFCGTRLKFAFSKKFNYMNVFDHFTGFLNICWLILLRLIK